MHDHRPENSIALVVSGSKSTFPFLQLIKEKGLVSYVFDNDSNAYCRNYCDRFFNVSAHDFNEIKQIINPYLNKFKAVLCFSSFQGAMTSSAYLNELISKNKPIAGYTVNSVENTFNKSSQKKVLLENKITTPALINMPKEKDFPIVVKKNDSVGSNGVEIFHSIRSFSDKYRERSFENILIEKFISGRQIMVAGYVANRKISIIGLFHKYVKVINEKPLTLGFESVLESEYFDLGINIEALKNDIEAAIDALNINNHFFGVDIIIDNKGKHYSIEYGYQLDAKIDRLLCHAGYDPYDLLMEILLGKEPVNDLTVTHKKIFLQFIYSNRNGVLGSVRDEGKIIELNCNIGDKVNSPKGLSDIIGWHINLDPNYTFQKNGCSNLIKIKADGFYE